MAAHNHPEAVSSIGNTDLFPIVQNWHYFNHAGIAPVCKPAADALRRYAEEAQSSSYLGTSWFSDLGKVRESAARLINASPDEIALTKNTAEGLSSVARGLKFAPGDRIVTTGVEYPANIYPWMDLQRHNGVELDLVAEESTASGTRQIPLDKLLAAASKPKTKLLTLSHVEFASGQQHDLATIGKFCRERGIYFCVDAIQSLGAIPVDVQAMQIDFLAAGGQKWLLAPLGSGIFYVRKELIAQMRPLIIGASNVTDEMNFGHYDYTLRADARRFESGGAAWGSLFGLRASIDMLMEIGMDFITRRLHEVTSHLADGIRKKGYQLISERSGDSWSGIVCFIAPGREKEHEALFSTLRKGHRCEIALREGRLRASPHFYTPDQHVDDLIDAFPTL